MTICREFPGSASFYAESFFSRILLYSGRSISCADKTNAKSPLLRKVPGQIAPAQWPVGNVLFPTRLRCVLFAKFCFRSLKFTLFRKAKSLGCFSGLSERGFVGLGKHGFEEDLSRPQKCLAKKPASSSFMYKSRELRRRNLPVEGFRIHARRCRI